MSCDDCKRPYKQLPYGVTFSVLDESIEVPVEVKSRHDPTPDFTEVGWLKLCVDCIKERRKRGDRIIC